MSDNASVGGTKDEDLERLASRIAMLAADDGEADAAGRAVGSLARRLGLTGGHLKAIFLAGAGKLAAAGRQAAEQSARAERFQSEAGQLRHSLDQVDVAFQQMSQERDEAVAAAVAYREELERARNGRRLALLVSFLTIFIAMGVVAFVLLGPPLRPLLGMSYDLRSPMGHTASVREPGAVVTIQPDLATTVLYRLPAGTMIPVRQLLWRDFIQWAETSIGGQQGYVPVTRLTLEPDCH